MSYHEPTIEEIRHTYLCMFIPAAQAERGQAFDAWLAEHDRQVAEKAWDEGYVHGYVIGVEEGATGRLVEAIAPNTYQKEAHP